MTTILKAISDRRSIRKYSQTPVSKEQIFSVLQAASLAPSGKNTQPARFLVVTDEETKKKIVAEDKNQTWMLQAPVFVVCMADISSRTGLTECCFLTETDDRYDLKRVIRDTSAAVENLMLQATHIGLSTCWTGGYVQSDMRRAISVPNEFYICGVLTLGYAAENPEPRPRKPLEEIVRFENWD